MLTKLVVAVLLFVPLMPASSARQDAAGDGAARVKVTLTALDKGGQPVEGLKPEDVRVGVEGVEQKIVEFAAGTKEPLHFVIMLDASASQEVTLPFEQLAAKQFVSELLRPGVDDAAVVAFTGDAEIVGDLAGNAEVVRRAIASVQFVPPNGYIAGGVIVGTPGASDPNMRAASTAIWDSLGQVCELVFARAGRGRKAVILFTDGVDTSSRMKKDKAVERLLREGASVYSIGIGDEQSFEGVDRESLRDLSKRTGGRAFFPRKGTDIAKVLEQLRRELSASYTVELAPVAPKSGGKLNKLRFEVVNPELRARGVELAYPQGFYFGAPSARR